MESKNQERSITETNFICESCGKECFKQYYYIYDGRKICAECRRGKKD